jgi:hypothetical protein
MSTEAFENYTGTEQVYFMIELNSEYTDGSITYTDGSGKSHTVTVSTSYLHSPVDLSGGAPYLITEISSNVYNYKILYDISNKPIEYEVGDTISLVVGENAKRFSDFTTITKIEGWDIWVADLPRYGITEEGGWGDYITARRGGFYNNCVTCNSKPKLTHGVVLSKYSLAVGRDNFVNEHCSFASGRDNKIIGQYGAGFGRKNTAGFASVAGGFGNNVSGQYSVGFGQSNAIGGGWSIGAGYSNTVNADCGGAFGQNNAVNDQSGFAFGDGNIVGHPSFVAGCSNSAPLYGPHQTGAVALG